MSASTRKLTISAVLLGIMLMLGWLESLFSIGIPGVKIGLSNSVLLISLWWLGIWPSFALMGMKVLLAGFLYGSVSSMMYAFAGGLLSMIVMTALLYGVCTSFVTAGVGGGIFHNLGQILLSMLILRTDRLFYFLAILMAVGALVGAGTGTVAQLLMRHIKRPPAGKEGAR